jgi:hypothetical protein
VYLAGTFEQTSLAVLNQYSNPGNCYCGPKQSFIAKYNGNTGIGQWAKILGNPGTYDEVTDMVTDSKGNLYVFGNQGGGMPACSDTMVNPNLFFAKYDSNGTCLWYQYGIGAAGAHKMILKHDSIIYLLAGCAQGYKWNGFTATTGGMYLLVFSNTNWPTSIPPAQEQAPLELHPNPAHATLQVSGGATIINCSNIMGQSFTLPLAYSTTQHQVYNTLALPAGVYIVTLQSAGQVQYKKVVINH